MAWRASQLILPCAISPGCNGPSASVESSLCMLLRESHGHCPRARAGGSKVLPTAAASKEKRLRWQRPCQAPGCSHPLPQDGLCRLRLDLLSLRVELSRVPITSQALLSKEDAGDHHVEVPLCALDSHPAPGLWACLHQQRLQETARVSTPRVPLLGGLGVLHVQDTLMVAMIWSAGSPHCGHARCLMLERDG